MFDLYAAYHDRLPDEQEVHDSVTEGGKTVVRYSAFVGWVGTMRRRYISEREDALVGPLAVFNYVGFRNFVKEIVASKILLGVFDREEKGVVKMSAPEPTVNYAHEKNPEGIRFRQYEKDPLPPWAVDIRRDNSP